MLLGMPWNEETNPDTDYVRKTVSVHGKLLSMKNDNVSSIKIGNTGKKFRSLLGMERRQSEVAVFRLHSISDMPRVKLTPDLLTFDHEDLQLAAIMEE